MLGNLVTEQYIHVRLDDRLALTLLHVNYRPSSIVIILVGELRDCVINLAVTTCHQNAHTLIPAYQLDQVCFESLKIHLYHTEHSHGLRFYMYIYSYQQMKCQ